LFLLFGAIVVTDNFKSINDIGLLTWIIFGLTFIHVFLMDALGGGLKDAKNDSEAKAKTLAVFLGIKVNKKLFIPLSYKLIILVFEFLTILLVTLTFFFYGFDYSMIQLILIIILIVFMVFSTLNLLNIKTFDRKKIKYHNRNHELAAYILVPIVLLNYIGIYWTIYLIFFPVVWFIIFNYIFYRDSWVNPKNF
jgi:hypothetical protein